MTVLQTKKKMFLKTGKLRGKYEAFQDECHRTFPWLEKVEIGSQLQAKCTWCADFKKKNALQWRAVHLCTCIYGDQKVRTPLLLSRTPDFSKGPQILLVKSPKTPVFEKTLRTLRLQ